jgi:hypothetical protein
MQRARALDAPEGTVDWEQVAQMLGTRRTHASVQQHWYMLSRETAGEPPGIEAPQPRGRPRKGMRWSAAVGGWKVDPNWRGEPLPVGTALTDSAPYSSDDGSASVPLKRPRPLPTGASAAAAAVTASPAATAVPATSPPTAAPSALTMPARAAHQAALMTGLVAAPQIPAQMHRQQPQVAAHLGPQPQVQVTQLQRMHQPVQRQLAAQPPQIHTMTAPAPHGLASAPAHPQVPQPQAVPTTLLQTPSLQPVSVSATAAALASTVQQQQQQLLQMHHAQQLHAQNQNQNQMQHIQQRIQALQHGRQLQVYQHSIHTSSAATAVRHQ